MNEDQLVTPVSVNIAKLALKERFPEITIESIKYIGGGSHSVFAVNDTYIFRFPKIIENLYSIDDAKNIFIKEREHIKVLRDQLKPHQTVNQIFLSLEPSESFLGPIAGYNLINEKHTGKNDASLLGNLLSKLHKIQQSEFDKSMNVPTVEYVKQKWQEDYRETKEISFQYLNIKEREWFCKLYDDFLSRIDLQQPNIVLTHGDLDPTNVLVGENHKNLTLIDLDELGYWDSVNDFCVWYGKYGENFINQMLKNYSIEVDSEFLTRSLFYYNRIPHIYFFTGYKTGNNNFIDFGKNLLSSRMK